MDNIDIEFRNTNIKKENNIFKISMILLIIILIIVLYCIFKYNYNSYIILILLLIFNICFYILYYYFI